MGRSATRERPTTEAVRRAIQHSQERLRGLAKRYGVNPKTVAKWKARSSVSDLPTGSPSSPDRQSCQPRKRPSSSPSEAAYFAAARRLPVRSAADRPASDPLVPSTGVCNATGSPGCRRSKANALRFKRKFEGPIQSAILAYSTSPRFETAQGKLYLLVAIDRTCKVRLRRDAREGGAPHRGGLPAPPDRRRPYKVHAVLSRQRNSLHHTRQYESAAPDIKAALEAEELVWAHAFEYACAQNDIDHRLTKRQASMDNGQVERMNRRSRRAVKRYFYETHDQLRAHLRNFVDAYNIARRLKP